jgi:hypothetical protein
LIFLLSIFLAQPLTLTDKPETSNTNSYWINKRLFAMLGRNLVLDGLGLTLKIHRMTNIASVIGADALAKLLLAW